MGDTRTLAREHVCMQHAHILAPPTRTAGWYLRVRQSETIYHLRTITTSMAKRNISPGTGLEPAQRTAADQETEGSTTAATAAA
ncbi:unnamed protein product [Acanthoscelides obtectus]|uniref:Uncharacterized protein n=1 Tax=Acanthoscelides obtectus TaxID=200917 RepID=A0A9P0KVE9_ACAOB|nr:unnamed protein product [Acanthoscelides obtectus]CAH1982537.1 unnamed protein product [Acanthoscelides obtectus]CAK1621919.1 hypothetical protein AOBTE_LOCUS1218 [Acanthoscelides obtectus]CAK1674561.1 hypothetical protein AOBTE_LOCUS29660 [Acanthoscelides obtectus]